MIEVVEGSAVHQDSIVRARLGKRLGHVALFVALAVVPVLALNSFATAETGADSHAVASDARECLAEQGVTVPTPGTAGERPFLTLEQRQALRAAARTCGIAGGWPRVALRPLTDEQRQCLVDRGVTLPRPSADGVRPQIAGDQRAALRAAAAACGLPARGERGALAGDHTRV
jgi:hypothetical protein